MVGAPARRSLLLLRKFFYLFPSILLQHWVTLCSRNDALKLLFYDCAFVISGFALLWVAIFMSSSRLRLDISVRLWRSLPKRRHSEDRS